jgi:shikimate kinase
MHKTAEEKRAEKKKAKLAEQERIQKLKEENPNEYLSNLYENRRTLMEKIQDRQNKRAEVSKRGSKAAHRRMQVLAELGQEEK